MQNYVYGIRKGPSRYTLLQVCQNWPEQCNCDITIPWGASVAVAWPAGLLRLFSHRRCLMHNEVFEKCTRNAISNAWLSRFLKKKKSELTFWWRGQQWYFFPFKRKRPGELSRRRYSTWPVHTGFRVDVNSIEFAVLSRACSVSG